MEESFSRHFLNAAFVGVLGNLLALHPSRKCLDPLREADARLIPKQAARFGQVRKIVADVAEAEGAGHLDLHVPAITLDKRARDSEHVGGQAGADADHFAGRLRSEKCQAGRLDDVIDEHEVTALPAILEDVDWVPVQNTCREDRQDARIGVLQRLPWPINVLVA